MLLSVQVAQLIGCEIQNVDNRKISGDTVVSRVSSISNDISSIALDIRRSRRYCVSLREPARYEHLRFSDLNNDSTDQIGSIDSLGMNFMIKVF